jgi:hypothetical protein
MHEIIMDTDKDVLISAGMLADRLRPLVLASCDGPEPNRYGSSCLNGTPMIPIHRATLGAIYQHLERIAQRAETATKIGGSVHDGPVGEADAPDPCGKGEQA